MPYWAVTTKKEDYKVVIKVNGPNVETDQTKFKELAEFLDNIAPARFSEDSQLAKYLAEKTANAVREDPNAVWVEAHVFPTAGFIHGYTVVIDGELVA